MTDDVLTPDAVEFLHVLQRELGFGREEILAARMGACAAVARHGRRRISALR